MRLCSIRMKNHPVAGIFVGGKVVPIHEINSILGTSFSISLGELIFQEQVDDLRRVTHNVSLVDFKGVRLPKTELCAPYTRPEKIWGIGLNYPDHAKDLQADCPVEEPASFIKPASSIIGHGQAIRLPSQSSRVTGEAEIGVIISKECKNVSIGEVHRVILGYTPIIDMTAVDILERNPRYLTRSKSFDTFFSFGPWIVTRDEIPDVSQLTVKTLKNGKVCHSNTVANMTFSPDFLVSFHSEVMTFKPGDILSCGTPGAVLLKPGDRVGCEIEGIGLLENPVQ
jgi:2-keto-4-pentenoate hydratase/2-oxohepta-3-ene-1,7-dioic acid hydratase in catechol pathway